MTTAALTPPLETPPPAAAKPAIAVYRVFPDCLDLMWPAVEPLLAKAIVRERGRYSTRDLYTWIRNNDRELWVATEKGRCLVAMLIQFGRYPSGKRSACVHLGAGERARDWVRPFFEAWSENARLRGVTELRLVGRKGWLRYFKPFGFKVDGLVLTREE